jgi:hypothetical protein
VGEVSWIMKPNNNLWVFRSHDKCGSYKPIWVFWIIVHFAGRLPRLDLWVLFIIGFEAQKDWLMLGPILFPKHVFKTKSISSMIIENLCHGP